MTKDTKPAEQWRIVFSEYRQEYSLEYFQEAEWKQTNIVHAFADTFMDRIATFYPELVGSDLPIEVKGIDGFYRKVEAVDAVPFKNRDFPIIGKK